MKNEGEWMKTLRTAVLPIWIACLPLSSWAADVQVTTSTQTPWYRDYLSDGKAQGEIAQYLRMNASRIDDDGKISVYGYGRLLGQFSSGFESRARLGFPLESDVLGRLYYFYLDYRDVVKDHLDARAGRTFVPAAAMTGTIDGLHLDFRDVAPLGPISLGATAFGGHRATFVGKGEIGAADDTLWGGSVYFDTARFTRIEASYARKLTDGSLAQEVLALDVSTTPIQAVNVTGRLKYDLVSSRYNEAQAAVSVSLAVLVLRGEFFSSYPSFDKLSFYRFFEVNHFQQLSVIAEYRLHPGYRLSARYANERFDDANTADAVEVGVSARPIDALAVNVGYEGRRGYAGQLAGIRASASYRLRRATLLAGIDYDDFRRDLAREGTAKKYYAGLSYEFSRKISALARLEDNFNFYSNNVAQGYLAFNVNL
jgi:hypothetical protein